MIGPASTVSRGSAEGLVRHVAATEPDIVTLAEVVALAVRVDPALLRAARRRFVAHRGPDLEADLWHSPLVSASNRTGIVLDEAIAERLRYRLARHQGRCEQAREIITTAHGGLDDSPPGWMPDTFRLEEELRYLALVPDGHGRARELLQEVISQVESSGAEGLQSWLKGLYSRLPLSLRSAMPTTVPSDWQRGGLQHEAHGGRTIGIRLLEASIEIRAAPYGTMHHLRLPDGPPPAVFIDGRFVQLEALPHVEPLEDPSAATVQALDGVSVILRRRRRQTSPRRPGILRGHTSVVWGCAFSPDGTLLATTSADHTVRLWDSATGTPLHVLTGHSSRVRSCAFSPDGVMLASAGADGTVRLWDITTGDPLRILSGHRSSVHSCAFSPNGVVLASTGADGTVRLWDTGTRTVLPAETGYDDPVERRAHQPDGAHLARADGAVSILSGHTSEVWACAFSPDGSLLATTSNDRTVRLWRPGTGTMLHTLTRHSDSVEGCAFSPDGSVLATASRDRTVRLWDTSDGTLLHTLTGHTNSVWACAFSPDGSLLATTSNDRTVRLWDPTTGSAVHTLAGHSSRVHSCAFSPDGSLLATTGDDQTIRLWDPTVAPPLHRLEGHTSWVHSCAYAPDGSLLATTSADHTVRLWNPTTGAPLHTLTGHTGSVEGCAFSPDTTVLATAGADHTVRLWDPTSGRALQTLTGHTDRVHACAFSPDGSLLASASADETVGLWDAATGSLLRSFIALGGSAHSCAFSPDGTVLATAGADQTVRLWDPGTGTLLHTLTGHIREVLACAFSADGALLASVSNDQTVRLWDPVAGEPRATLRGHTSRIHACAFSPDGSVLATAGADQTIRLWDPEGGEPIDSFVGTSSMLDCAFSPDGTTLAATGTDWAVTIWNLLTRDVAEKGDTVALWLSGNLGDAAAIAGAVAARPLTAGCTPVIAVGGGALPGVLLAAGLDLRAVQRLVVSTPLVGRSSTLLERWKDPARRLARHLADLGVERCGDLRVPVRHELHRYRFHAVVVDAATGELAVLPRDAERFQLDPDAISLADLVLAASGARDVTLGKRRFTSALGRTFDPGPWYDDPPVRQPVLAVDVEDRGGTVPARRFPTTLPVTTATIPWLYLPSGATPSRRHREVLARIGAQSLRAALTDHPTRP